MSNKNQSENNASLLQRIENRRKTKNEAENEVRIRMDRYMIFTIREWKYALYADDVREIIGGIPIFFVPFTPRYIRGFINRQVSPIPLSI